MSRRLLNWPKSYDRLADEIVRKNSVVVASVNHTGTWFLLRFLSSFPSSGGTELLEVHDALARNAINERSIMYFHVGGVPDMWDWFEHLRDRLPVLVPLRDPMQALITRQARHPFLDHSYQVDAFVKIATSDHGLAFVPVDCEEQDRLSVLTRAVTTSGWCLPNSHIETWASSWPVHNSVGCNTAEKQWYRDGNKTGLRSTLSVEIDALLNSRDILIPFLKKQGYKELPWWSW